MFAHRWLVLAGCVALVAPAVTPAADPPGPAYQIVLRSRTGEAHPSKSKDAQTGGGAILVEQPEPNTITILMSGAVVAGSECKGSSASLDFHLDQCFDIVPTRHGVRPPRIGMVGRVVGTLQVSDGGKKCGKGCGGSAEQSCANASLLIGDHGLLSIDVPGSSAGAGGPVAVNNRQGPVEAVGTPGSYTLNQSFNISASQGKGVWNRQYAVADFDPAPQLDGFWSDALKPFRAIPRKDFGFRVVVRVVEDVPVETR